MTGPRVLFIGGSGIISSASTRLAVEHDRATVRKDQPVPDKKDALLAVADLGVILTDQPSALWDQQVSAGRTVVDRLGDLRDDLAGKVGAEARDERGRDR